MKAISIINFKWQSVTTAFLLSLVLGLFGSASQIFAHGGEDHGDAKPKVAVTTKGTVLRTTRLGDFEITLKHFVLEPDTAATAKLFVTRYATNEPSGDTKPAIEITASDGKTYEASEVSSDAPGSYAFNLPPLPAGNYTMLARLTSNGETDTATFSNVTVEPAAAASLADAAGWARTALLVLAGIAVLGLLGGLGYFAVRFAKPDRINEEAVSA